MSMIDFVDWLGWKGRECFFVSLCFDFFPVTLYIFHVLLHPSFGALFNILLSLLIKINNIN